MTTTLHDTLLSRRVCIAHSCFRSTALSGHCIVSGLKFMVLCSPHMNGHVLSFRWIEAFSHVRWMVWNIDAESNVCALYVIYRSYSDKNSIYILPETRPYQREMCSWNRKKLKKEILQKFDTQYSPSIVIFDFSFLVRIQSFNIPLMVIAGVLSIVLLLLKDVLGFQFPNWTFCARWATQRHRQR